MAPSSVEILQFTYGTSSLTYLILFAASSVTLLLLLLLCSFLSSFKRKQIDLISPRRERPQSKLTKITKRDGSVIKETNGPQNGVITKDSLSIEMNKENTHQANGVDISGSNALKNGKKRMLSTDRSMDVNKKSLSIKDRQLPKLPQSNETTESQLAQSQAEDPLYDTLNEKLSTSLPKEEDNPLVAINIPEVQDNIKESNEDETKRKVETTVNQTSGSEPLYAVVCKKKSVKQNNLVKQNNVGSFESETSIELPQMEEVPSPEVISRQNGEIPPLKAPSPISDSHEITEDKLLMMYKRAKERNTRSFDSESLPPSVSISVKNESPPTLPEKHFDLDMELQQHENEDDKELALPVN
ncbi:uncharacterized protein O3C94_005695 isoform 2-T2 [Discoglossus pictus]